MAQKELPGWFPFAVAASFLLMVGAGIRSGWRTSPKPSVKQGGMLQGPPPSRWFLWYVLPRGAASYNTHGPEHLTDQEAFRLEFVTKTDLFGARLYRFVWIPTKGIWVHDARNDPALLASREIRDAQGVVVAA